MSCFLCSDKHLNVIISFLDAENALSGIPPQSALDDLKYVNLKAVNERYSENEKFAKAKYKGSAQWSEYSPVQILKLLDCYEYQASDYSEYELSAAPHLINRARSRAIDRLPGYNDAKWSL